MTADERPPQSEPTGGGLATGLFIIGFGVAQVAIIWALLVLDTPVAGWARRAAETWHGRIALGLAGMGLICIGMITVLTIAERYGRRRKTRTTQD